MKFKTASIIQDGINCGIIDKNPSSDNYAKIKRHYDDFWVVVTINNDMHSLYDLCEFKQTLKIYNIPFDADFFEELGV